MNVSEDSRTGWSMKDEKHWLDGIRDRYCLQGAKELLTSYIEACKKRTEWGKHLSKQKCIAYARIKLDLL